MTDQDPASKLLALSDDARSIIQAMAARKPLVLGIHVRQTDFRRWNGGAYFRDSAFYNRLAFGALSVLGGEWSVFIAQDGEFEPEPTLREDPRVEISTGSADRVICDFVQLAGCDLLVGPWSTFTDQAANLGGTWLAKRRDLLVMQPHHTVDDLLTRVESTLRDRAVR